MIQNSKPVFFLNVWRSISEAQKNEAYRLYDVILSDDSNDERGWYTDHHFGISVRVAFSSAWEYPPP